METVFSGLLLALVGGLAWIAYHHHEAYGRWAWILGTFFGLIGLVGIATMATVNTTLNTISDKFPVVQLKPMQEAMTPFMTGASWVMYVGFALSVYTNLLMLLPIALDLQKKKPHA